MDRFSHGVAEVTDVGIYYTENAAAVNFEKKKFCKHCMVPCNFAAAGAYTGEDRRL